MPTNEVLTYTVAAVVFAVAMAGLAFGTYRRPGLWKGCCGWIAGFRGTRKGHGGESPPGASGQALRDCLERSSACGSEPAEQAEGSRQEADGQRSATREEQRV